MARAREFKEAELKRKAQEEEDNLQRAKAEGAVADCGCCYEELALSSMVHCAGDTTHWFCRSCAKQMAEHVVGLSKYHLGCMSVDGCDATFSRDQKELFLDEKLANALGLIEQEAVLRLAGIENLENCPFCPYAAEYPPIEENKEFRCENPECHLVSCRLCREETHIPKTCGEAAKERGHSARRVIEEAMSAALIRKCNKCRSLPCRFPNDTD
jgi:TRIAD3 protein (E3 ubiquitin-protein ligase RNF216)